MSEETMTFLVEDATLVFKNFTGREGPFNREGDRNFSVILDHDTAARMLEDGWNIKYLQPRDEGDEPTPVIEVAVKFKIRPPRIILITSSSRTQLTEKEVDMLDVADIKTVDIFCRAYRWEVGEKTGIKAYLQTMMVTINEDPLEKKYQIFKDPPSHSED